MISVVSVGIGNWKKYTLPMIESWREHMKNVSELIVVDNGSDPQYPRGSDYRRFIIPSTVSYPEAINWGITEVWHDWVLIVNNDVLFTGTPPSLADLPKGRLYTKEILTWNYKGLKIPYPRGWLYLLHVNILNEIGEFDGEYEHAVVDDLDYGWRAWKMGIPTALMDFPIKHLAQPHHEGRSKAKQRNMELFRRKHGFEG